MSASSKLELLRTETAQAYQGCKDFKITRVDDLYQIASLSLVDQIARLAVIAEVDTDQICGIFVVEDEAERRKMFDLIFKKAARNCRHLDPRFRLYVKKFRSKGRQILQARVLEFRRG